VRRLTVPLLVLRGAEDRLSTREWAKRLAGGVPGAHAFPWLDPQEWSATVRRFARRPPS
jgi:pimeloyl-ACP methyl ester carboxylesterase